MTEAKEPRSQAFRNTDWNVGDTHRETRKVYHSTVHAVATMYASNAVRTERAKSLSSPRGLQGLTFSLSPDKCAHPVVDFCRWSLSRLTNNQE